MRTGMPETAPDELAIAREDAGPEQAEGCASRTRLRASVAARTLSPMQLKGTS